MGAMNALEHLCPELKESESEKIKKQIIGFITYSKILDETKKNWVSWLEKQGEQKPTISYDALREGIGHYGITQYQIDYWLKKYVDVEKQGEQKPTDKVEPKFKVGQTIKKEGFNFGFTIVKTEDGFYYNDMGDYFPFTDQDNWELVEQKPTEWSEEDRKIIIELVGIFESAIDGGHVSFPYRLIKDYIRVLKSCLPQSTLKPSEEMLEALYRVIPENMMEKSKDDMLLDKLYQGLKYGKVLSEK